MKYIYILIGLTLISVLTFCAGEKDVTGDEAVVNNTISTRLSESSMYKYDSIVFAQKVATEAQKNEGRKYFLRAMDMYVNKQQPRESIKFFKEAAMYFPDERMYYFLTKAYIDINEPDSASAANAVCGQLGYEPYYEVSFNDALINAIKQDSTNCITALTEAVDNGFLNKKRIVNEKRFDFIRDDDRYIGLIVNTFNDDAKLKQGLFKNYIKSFADILIPYGEPADSIGNHNGYPYISYDYAAFIPDMEDGRFARDVTNEYLSVGKLNTKSSYFAMIYKTYLAIADTLNPVKTYIVTYDSIGNFIDREMIGCFCSPMMSQEYAIGKDNVIEMTAYSYKWQNDPLEKGYAGNKIISFDAEKQKQIQITETGEIKRDKVAATDIKPIGQ